MGGSASRYPPCEVVSMDAALTRSNRINWPYKFQALHLKFIRHFCRISLMDFRIFIWIYCHNSNAACPLFFDVRRKPKSGSEGWGGLMTGQELLPRVMSNKCPVFYPTHTHNAWFSCKYFLNLPTIYPLITKMKRCCRMCSVH